jgi:transcription antitermination factor NusG
MGKIELEALRRRARRDGIAPGSLIHAERLKARAIQDRISAPSTPPNIRAPRPERRLSEPMAIEVEGARWVVAYVGEHAARDVAADLTELGFRAYCPLGRRVVYQARVAGKRARRVRQFPVFGGYLFVGEVTEHLSKSSHDRIVEILGDSTGSLALKGAAIAAINLAELAGRWDSTRPHHAAPLFHAGDLVRIKAGPFAGFAAVVARLPKDLRVMIDVQMFGGPTRTTLDSSALELTVKRERSMTDVERYALAPHAMQSGVAIEMNYRSEPTAMVAPVAW